MNLELKGWNKLARNIEISFYLLHLPTLVLTWVAVEPIEEHEGEWVQHMHLMHGGGVCHIISRNIGGLLKALCFHPQNQTQRTRDLEKGNPRSEADLIFWRYRRGIKEEKMGEE